jgi:hypothetical protein
MVQRRQIRVMMSLANQKLYFIFAHCSNFRIMTLTKKVDQFEPAMALSLIDDVETITYNTL